MEQNERLLSTYPLSKTNGFHPKNQLGSITYFILFNESKFC